VPVENLNIHTPCNDGLRRRRSSETTAQHSWPKQGIDVEVSRIPPGNPEATKRAFARETCRLK